MTSKIERVVKRAQTTFSGLRTSNDIRRGLAELKRNADELDAQSVGMDARLLRRDAYELADRPSRPCAFVRHALRRRLPVTYVRVFEDRDVSVGMFVLRDGAEIPLHDHPHMHGVLKVVHGKVEIQSYTPRRQERGRTGSDFGRDVDAMKMAPVVVGVADDACVLYPEQGNVHRVAARNGPAVFVDILAPPYGAGDPPTGRARCCRYFKEVNHSKGTKLTIVPAPSSYRSDTAPYTGPRFSTIS